MKRITALLVLGVAIAWATPAGATSHAKARLSCAPGGGERVTVHYAVPLADHAQVVTITVTNGGRSTVLADHVRVRNGGTYYNRMIVGHGDVSVSFETRHEAESIGLPALNC